MKGWTIVYFAWIIVCTLALVGIINWGSAWNEANRRDRQEQCETIWSYQEDALYVYELQELGCEEFIGK